METNTFPRAIVINAKRWFDKVNGNTYHSVECLIDDNVPLYQGLTYGYDDQWRYTAIRLMQDNNKIPKFENNTPAWKVIRHLKDNNCLIIENCIDVNRKKDL